MNTALSHSFAAAAKEEIYLQFHCPNRLDCTIRLESPFKMTYILIVQLHPNWYIGPISDFADISKLIFPGISTQTRIRKNTRTEISPSISATCAYCRGGQPEARELRTTHRPVSCRSSRLNSPVKNLTRKLWFATFWSSFSVIAPLSG